MATDLTTARWSTDSLTSVGVVVRAIVAGAAGGALAAVFVVLVGEDIINAAIALETSPPDAGDPIVGRGLQVVGGGIAAVLYGVFAGAIFGTVFASIRHLIPAAGDFGRSVLLAAAAFTAAVIVPAVKYPADPPAVGDPDTIDERTIDYFTLLGASLTVMIAVFMIFTRVAPSSRRCVGDRLDSCDRRGGVRRAATRMARQSRRRAG